MKNKIIVISVLMMMSIIFMSPRSYGALSSKPTNVTDGSNVVVNKNVSTSYVLCQQMTSNGESLYGATVKPHLATNKDWGAVSYLSNSIYGTNTAGQNTGIQITINGVKYYSTTGNASGVMNWGINPNKRLYTQTSGLISNLSSGNNTNLIELYKNKDTEYVEFVNPTASGNGMATIETDNIIYNVRFYVGTVNAYPVSIRRGLFSGTFGVNFDFGNGRWTSSGAAYDDVTFRSVVWN